MQDLLQRLQGLTEIVASGPVIMSALDEKLKSVSPAEALMILINLRFTMTRPAPDTNRRRANAEYNFIDIRTVQRSNFV